MVAVPETVGVHWKTCSGDSPERPQLPASALVPLVVPLKVPPGAGMAVGLLQAPPPGRVVVVVGTGSSGGVTVRLNVPCDPPYPSTTMKYVCPAVTVGVMREARLRPLEFAHASSLHPDTTSAPPEHTPLRMYRIVSKFVAAPHVWIVAVPETVGVHWKTRSGEFAELPQLPASELVPLVVPLKVPPCAGMTVGLLQAPASALEDCPAWPWQT